MRQAGRRIKKMKTRELRTEESYESVNEDNAVQSARAPGIWDGIQCERREISRLFRLCPPFRDIFLFLGMREGTARWFLPDRHLHALPKRSVTVG